MEQTWEQLISHCMGKNLPVIPSTEEQQRLSESFYSDQIHHLKTYRDAQLNFDRRKDGISHFLGILPSGDFFHGLNPVPDRSTIYVHDFYELMYVLKGEFQIGIHDGIIVLQEGDICLMDAQCVHWDLNAGVDSTTFYLTEENLEKKRVRFHPKKEQLLIQTEHYILAHLDTVTASSLAQNLHYNTRYYNRLIQECYHMTLTEYIQKKKLNEAKRLLCCTRLPIHEIISRVGYQNRNYFYKLFYKEMAMTPQEYRKQYLNQ